MSEMLPLTKFACEVVMVNRADLKRAPYNPRTITDEARRKLRNSLKTFKLVDLPIWNVKTGNIVGGHQRLEQLDTLEGGQDYSLQVVKVSLSHKRERELNVALNNPSMSGEYDVDKLFALIADTKTGFDLEAAGMEVMDLEYLSENSGVDMPEMLRGFDEQELQAAQPIVNEVSAMLDAVDGRTAKAQAAEPDDEPDDVDAEPGSDDAEPMAAVDTNEGEPDVPSEPADEIAAIKAAKERYKRRSGDDNETDYSLTIVCPSNAHKHAICSYLGIERNDVVVDLSKIETGFGIEVRVEGEGKDRVGTVVKTGPSKRKPKGS